MYLIYTEQLFGAAMKNTYKTLFLVLRFKRATSFVVFIFLFLWSSRFWCVRTRYDSISLAFYID